MIRTENISFTFETVKLAIEKLRMKFDTGSHTQFIQFG